MRCFHKKLIFALDRTLWRQTIEWHPRIKRPTILKETHDVLRYVQRHHYLYVASRSAESDKCHHFLNTYFPDIHFTARAIYPTPFGKIGHIRDLKCHDGSFVFFDDEAPILNEIKQMFPNAQTVLCTSPLSWKDLTLKR